MVFLDGALVDDPTAPARFGASSLAPLLLAGRGARPPGVAEAVPPEDAAGVAARVRVLAEFGALRREAAEVGLKPADLAAEFERSGLPAGLVDERWLLLPGRVRLRDLADPAGVLSRHEAVCRLMGTAFGLFFDDGAPREGEAGESPRDALALLRLPRIEGRPVHGRGARRGGAGNAGGRGDASRLSGRHPPRLGPRPPLLPRDRLAARRREPRRRRPPGVRRPRRGLRAIRANPETIALIADETRFWVLHEDKVDAIRRALSSLADAVSREVSERYATAFELFRRVLSERRLAAKTEEVHEVTHAITHDLRKPLTSLTAMLGLLRGGRLGPLGDLQREAIETSFEAVRYMEELVDDLLESARLDTGRRRLAVEPVALPPLVEKIRRRFHYDLEERKIDFAAGPLPETVEADASALEKILMNLVGNSVSYIGSGERRIEVRAERADGEVRISVSDTGIGIPPEFMREPLRKFHRGTNVGSIRGTGLGLSIVKGLSEAHGGRLELRSEVGRGTTATVHLPLR